MKTITTSKAIGYQLGLITYGKLFKSNEYKIELRLPYTDWLGYHCVTIYKGLKKPAFKDMYIILAAWFIPYLVMAIIGAAWFVGMVLLSVSGALGLWEGLQEDFDEGLFPLAGRLFAIIFWVFGLVSLFTALC